jgi:hypothetical protein
MKYKVGDLVKFSAASYGHMLPLNGGTLRPIGCILKVRRRVLDVDGNTSPTYDIFWSCNVVHHRKRAGVCLERWLEKI